LKKTFSGAIHCWVNSVRAVTTFVFVRPTAAILDSQRVKSAGHGGNVGYDAGKRIKGRKRHPLGGWRLHWGDVRPLVKALRSS
jgi:hypothetical protein